MWSMSNIFLVNQNIQGISFEITYTTIQKEELTSSEKQDFFQRIT